MIQLQKSSRMKNKELSVLTWFFPKSDVARYIITEGWFGWMVRQRDGQRDGSEYGLILFKHPQSKFHSYATVANRHAGPLSEIWRASLVCVAF